MDAKLAGLAEKAILQLQEQNVKLENELKHFKLAHDLSMQLLKVGSIEVDDLESTFQDLNSKPFEELQVIEKAAEWSLTNDNLFNIGELSDRPADDGMMDPLTSFLLEDYQ